MFAAPMTDEPSRRRSGWPTAFVLIGVILAALVLAIFLRLESWPQRTVKETSAELERLARQVRNTFVEVANLQPKVTVNDRVYFEQTTEEAELATAARVTHVEHDFTHTWAGSTKRIRLRGTYNAKAGFDLRESVSVDVREGEIAVHMPRAKILGLESQQTEVLAYENGYWNRISATDLEQELAALQKLAREKAEQSGLPREAEEALQRQLQQKMGTQPPVRITFGAAPNPPKG
jgi:hypothetical protein